MNLVKIAKKKLFFMVAILLCLLSSNLYADSQKFSAEFFQPALGPNAFLMLDDTQTLHKFQFQGGVFNSYAYHPLDLTTGTGSRLRGIVDQQLVTDIVVAFGITEWIQLGLDMPLFLINKYQDPVPVVGTGLKNYFDMGDLRAAAKIRVLNPCTFPVGLAFVPFIVAPTGNSSHYAGDVGISGGMKGVVEYKPLKKISVVGNVGYRGGKKVSFNNVKFQHRLLFGTGVSVYLKKGVSIFAEINGDSAFEQFASDREVNPIEAGGGVKWKVGSSGVELAAGAGSCIVCGVKAARFRGTLGVSYFLNTAKYKALAQKESDKCFEKHSTLIPPLKLYGLEEECPYNPSDFNPKKLRKIDCPKYYELDYYADLVLRSPESPDKFKKGVHDKESLKLFTLHEQMKEGDRINVYTLALARMYRRCPEDPKDFDPQIHEPGCVKYYKLREGWSDIQNCPAPSEFAAGKANGYCREFYSFIYKMSDEQFRQIQTLAAQDTDNDNIDDLHDQCPSIHEDVDGFYDAEGCVEGGKVTIVGGEIKTVKPIIFAFDSWTLSKADKKLLRYVVELINSTEGIDTIRVGAHADKEGSFAANERTSMKRAEATIDEMKKLGVREDVNLKPVAYSFAKYKSVPRRAITFNLIFKKAPRPKN